MMRNTMQNFPNQSSVDGKSQFSVVSNGFRNASQDSRMGGSPNKKNALIEQEMKAIEKIKQKQKKEIE